MSSQNNAGFILGIVSGITILFFAFVVAGFGYKFTQTQIWLLLGATPFLKTLFTSFISIHILIGVLSLSSCALIKDDCHKRLGGLVLVAFSVIGILVGAGFFIGPLFGLIGGLIARKD